MNHFIYFRSRIHFFPVLWVLSIVFAGFQMYADVHFARSCKKVDVDDALSGMAPGDTLVLPPGDVVWPDQLRIDRGIILLGSGMDETIIHCGFDLPNPGNSTDSANYLISYTPSDPSLNEPFRISGFTLDMGGKCNAINLYNATTTALHSIRIDHNRIRNVTHSNGCGILVRGAVYGVIDSNVFRNANTPFKVLGNQAASWNQLVFRFGTAENLYIEDNDVEAIDDPVINSGWGGRYAARFNSFTTTRNLWPVFDMHGNLSSNNSLMGAEIYGNLIVSSSGYVELVDHRGGQSACLRKQCCVFGPIQYQVARGI